MRSCGPQLRMQRMMAERGDDGRQIPLSIGGTLNSERTHDACLWEPSRRHFSAPRSLCRRPQQRTKAVNLSATLDARADLGWALPMYTFATPVLGGQASV